MSEENITTEPTEDAPKFQCGCCGFTTEIPMNEYDIATNGDHHKRSKITLCEICSNTWDPIVGVEYPNNLRSHDTFRILRTIAHVGMMIISRLDNILRNQAIIIRKINGEDHI